MLRVAGTTLLLDVEVVGGATQELVCSRPGELVAAAPAAGGPLVGSVRCPSADAWPCGAACPSACQGDGDACVAAVDGNGFCDPRTGCQLRER